MRLDTHIHTEYSLDGVNKPREVLDHVRQFTSLDAIAFTDHNVQFPRKMAEMLTRDYGILVIPGIEIGDIRSGKHIVALNLDDNDVRPLLKEKDPDEIIDLIAAGGGIAIAAHPMRRGYSDFSKRRFDAVEVINGGCSGKCRQVDNPRGLPEIGCSDAHLKCHIGRAWTEVDNISLETFDEWTVPGTIRRITDNVIETLRSGLCHAGGAPCTDSRYLDYSLLVGKKYVGRSLSALRSLVL
jgi:predicted metal-dependent phosphoesterase TrpH